MPLDIPDWAAIEIAEELRDIATEKIKQSKTQEEKEEHLKQRNKYVDLLKKWQK